MDGVPAMTETESFPEPFTAALAKMALADAEFVGRWLRNNLGDSVAQQKLSREFVLGIALGLKLCQWEARGIGTHIVRGIPSGPQLVVTAFNLYDSPQLMDLVRVVGAGVCRITFEDFLWAADDQELEAFSLAVQTDADEERLLDLMAEYLANRVGEFA